MAGLAKGSDRGPQPNVRDESLTRCLSCANPCRCVTAISTLGGLWGWPKCALHVPQVPHVPHVPREVTAWPSRVTDRSTTGCGRRRSGSHLHPASLLPFYPQFLPLDKTTLRPRSEPTDRKQHAYRTLLRTARFGSGASVFHLEFSSHLHPVFRIQGRTADLTDCVALLRHRPPTRRSWIVDRG